mgnify:CR=1 FL=1|jgi:hypothetical protein
MFFCFRNQYRLIMTTDSDLKGVHCEKDRPSTEYQQKQFRNFNAFFIKIQTKQLKCFYNI